MKLRIQRISKKDLSAAHKIYNYYIKNSYTNFEEKSISFQEFKEKYEKIIKNKLPYLAAFYNDYIVGIAYLNYFRKKSGYRFAFEDTIYIHHKYTNKGIGYKLLKELINTSKKNKNIKIIVAVIGSIDSEGSIKLHKKLGFKKSGVLKKIGFKKNKWIDSIFLQKKI